MLATRPFFLFLPQDLHPSSGSKLGIFITKKIEKNWIGGVYQHLFLLYYFFVFLFYFFFCTCNYEVWFMGIFNPKKQVFANIRYMLPHKSFYQINPIDRYFKTLLLFVPSTRPPSILSSKSG